LTILIFLSLLFVNNTFEEKNKQIIKLKEVVKDKEKIPKTTTFAELYMKCLPLTDQESEGLKKEIKAREEYEISKQDS